MKTEELVARLRQEAEKEMVEILGQYGSEALKRETLLWKAADEIERLLKQIEFAALVAESMGRN